MPFAVPPDRGELGKHGPLGFLFGLGFDTATEVGLLGISAAQEASNGLSMWSILVFPALFTAGMTLIDTTDSILMVGAYGWAFAKPIRQLDTTQTITFVSAHRRRQSSAAWKRSASLAEKFGLQGGFWDAVAKPGTTISACSAISSSASSR